MNLHCCGITDVGKKRASNEDSFLITHVEAAAPIDLPVRIEFFDQVPAGGTLLAVSDGIGGSNAGEVASALAIHTLQSILQKASQAGDSVPILSNALQQTDAAVRAGSLGSPECAGMGATLTALWIRPDGATLGHVGDSRLYRLRNGLLKQLSTEHSPVGRMRFNGELTEEQARHHRLKHMIDQSLGGPEELFAPEIVPVDLILGDVVLICSDGLTDALEDAYLQPVLNQVAEGTASPAEASAFLIETSNEVYGRDNLTVVIAHLQ